MGIRKSNGRTECLWHYANLEKIFIEKDLPQIEECESWEEVIETYILN
jgi:hypothetical protein